MTTTVTEISSTRRRLFFHDSAAFLILTLMAGGLFGVTLFLFRSFEEHRTELAERWSARARKDIEAGRPELAIAPLRTAMLYAPDDQSYALLLAQALGDAGHTEEATNYFLNLWDVRPGDGFINLQLARLEGKRKDPAAAINYYRAAVYGTWEGDGVQRRREVRLELARYLIAQHDMKAAQTELLIAAGNAPESAELEEMFGDRFQEAGDREDAMAFYQRAIKDGLHDRSALAKAGTLAYEMGNYVEARGLLARAVRESSGTKRGTGAAHAELDERYERVDRIVELAPMRSLSGEGRADRVMASLQIARKRLTACMAGPGTAGGTVAPALADVLTRWSLPEAKVTRREALARDTPRQDALLKLAYDTEIQTKGVCGPPTGDDAALLRLAEVPPIEDVGDGARQGDR